MIALAEQIKTLRQRNGRKQALCAAVAIVLLIAAGFALKALCRSEPAPPPPRTEPAAGSEALEAHETPEAAGNAEASENAETAEESGKSPAWELAANQERLNCFLTAIVQQNIMNTGSDLDEDAELIRFAFGWRKVNDPESVLEHEEDGVLCRTLTLAQVNETLTAFFGKTVSPDQEDYSITLEEGECFRCVYRDGCFRNLPPYPAEEFPFPVRFALVESVDEESCTLHFRLYKINPYQWGVDEAERHVPILPLMTIRDAEGNNKATRGWISRIGRGEAVLRDLGEELQLVEMNCN